MKKEKDLEKLFRANRNNYSERPSPTAWRKLEERLNQHRRNRSHFNPMAAAATIIAMVGIMALLMLFTGKRREHPIADYRPQELKELPAITHDSKSKKVIEFTRKYHDRLSNPLGEK